MPIQYSLHENHLTSDPGQLPGARAGHGRRHCISSTSVNLVSQREAQG